MGLSLYIPAPSCHAGDYDAEGRSGGGGGGGGVCIRLLEPCERCAGQPGQAERPEGSVAARMLHANVRLESNRRAPGAAALQGRWTELYSSVSANQSQETACFSLSGAT